jgi:flagellar hook-length control protein FliK
MSPIRTDPTRDAAGRLLEPTAARDAGNPAAPFEDVIAQMQQRRAQDGANGALAGRGTMTSLTPDPSAVRTPLNPREPTRAPLPERAPEPVKAPAPQNANAAHAAEQDAATARNAAERATTARNTQHAARDAEAAARTKAARNGRGGARDTDAASVARAADAAARGDATAAAGGAAAPNEGAAAAPTTGDAQAATAGTTTTPNPSADAAQAAAQAALAAQAGATGGGVARRLARTAATADASGAGASSGARSGAAAALAGDGPDGSARVGRRDVAGAAGTTAAAGTTGARGPDGADALAASFDDRLAAAGVCGSGATAGGTPAGLDAGAQVAATATVPTSGAAATAATTAHASIATPFGQPGFADEVGQRIVMFAGQRISRAELSLNPEQLGPVRIGIEVRGNEASITLEAGQPTTRAALEEALPRLRELFEANGLQLTDAQVSNPFDGNDAARREAFAQAGADGQRRGNTGYGDRPDATDARRDGANGGATDGSAAVRRGPGSAQGPGRRLIDVIA